MSSVPQDSPSRGLIILHDLLKQVVTLSLASTGFLFTIHAAGYVNRSFVYAYLVSLGGFAFCIVTALCGQIAFVSAALREPSRLPRFFRSVKAWFGASWGGFVIGFGGLLVIAFNT